VAGSTWTIAGTAYTAPQRAAARIKPVDIFRTIDNGYDALAFSENCVGLTPSFHNGAPVVMQADFGFGTKTYFKGEVTDVQWTPTAKGYVIGYTALGLRYQADRVPVTAPDGTGRYVLNRDPQDPYFLTSDAGLTVGQCLSRALTVSFTANLLNAIGVGGYTSLSPPTLPASTVSDFALLTVVPRRPVVMEGECLINFLSQLVQRYQPAYVLELSPDGVFHVKDTTSTTVFVPQTLTLPGPGGAGTPGVQLPTLSRSTREVATQLILRGGPEGEATWLSFNDGTLNAAWSMADQNAWTLYDFTQPKDALDVGNITAIASTSATITSDSATETFAVNFWNGRQAVIFLYNYAASGIAQQEFRLVVSNTAMSAGGSATVNWDTNWPISYTAYTRYKLVGGAGTKNDVGRLLNVREPHTGATGLSTYIGAHLMARSPTLIRVANNDGTYAERYGSTATICWSSSGSPPYTEISIGVQPVPSTGQFRLVEPMVLPFGNPSDLQQNGWPTFAKGLPGEVRVLAFYSRGALQSTQPATGYAGTAYTVDGLQATKYMDYTDWIWKNDQSAMNTLASEHFKSLRDAVVEGTINIFGLAPFDALTFTNSLNIAVAGGTSPWSAMNAPIRAVRVTWATAGGEGIWLTQLHFSTRRKPFTADDLYVHPQFAPGSPLSHIHGFGMHESPYTMLGAAPGAAGAFGQMLGTYQSALQAGMMGVPVSTARPYDTAAYAGTGMAGLPSAAGTLGPSDFASTMDAAATGGWGVAPLPGVRPEHRESFRHPDHEKLVRHPDPRKLVRHPDRQRLFRHPDLRMHLGGPRRPRPVDPRQRSPIGRGAGQELARAHQLAQQADVEFGAGGGLPEDVFTHDVAPQVSFDPGAIISTEQPRLGVAPGSEVGIGVPQVAPPAPGRAPAAPRELAEAPPPEGPPQDVLPGGAPPAAAPPAAAAAPWWARQQGIENPGENPGQGE
jgi:hypothetical protein